MGEVMISPSEHRQPNKDDCQETDDCSVPKYATKAPVNRQTVAVDPAPFQQRGRTRYN